jgi:ribosomal protein S18 acetylase RimI-like enzyme
MSEQRSDMPGVLVRRIGADDWQQMRAVRLAALADAPYAFSSTLAREQAFDDEVWRSRAGSGRTFAAFDGTTIVGLATGLPADEAGGPGTPVGDEGHDAPAPADPEPDWHLVGMWVAPDYRGRGVADRLVDTVCAEARHAGATAVTLWVTETNDRAIAFYRRLGFAPTGARELVRPQEPDHWEKQLVRGLR